VRIPSLDRIVGESEPTSRRELIIALVTVGVVLVAHVAYRIANEGPPVGILGSVSPATMWPSLKLWALPGL